MDGKRDVSLPTKSGAARAVPPRAMLTLQSTSAGWGKKEGWRTYNATFQGDRNSQLLVRKRQIAVSVTRAHDIFSTFSCLSYRLRRRHLDSTNILAVRRLCVIHQHATRLRKPREAMLLLTGNARENIMDRILFFA